MDYNAYIFIFGHEKNKVANALLDTKIHNIQYISSVSVFVPIWLWGSSKKWPHSSTVTVLLLLRSVAKENSPKKLGNIFWGVNNWWCFFLQLQKKVRQASERDLRYQVKILTGCPDKFQIECYSKICLVIQNIWLSSFWELL